MIKSIRHKGLKRFFEKGASKGLNPQWVPRLRSLLAVLKTADQPKDMDLPGARLHPLKGDYAGFWSVDVTGNWRLVWRFDEAGNVHDVDLVDTH